MDKATILEQSKRFNSFYLYDEKVIQEAVSTLKTDFADVEFLYSVKANPFLPVLKSILQSGFGADAASLNEVLLSKKLGCENIYYSAPGKTEHDVACSIDKATIIADSPNEVLLIQKAAQKAGLTVKIGLRVNPDFAFWGGKGETSKFGIDEEQIYELIPQWKKLENISITGIHVHLHSQELNGNIIGAYHEKMFALAEKMQLALGTPLEFINLGSGIGIPYSKSDKPVDTHSLGKAAAELIKKYRSKMPETAIFIETGRFVSGKSGVYATKVLDKKTSRGKTYVILSNTLNGFIRPSVAIMAEKYSPKEFPDMYEPLYTEKGAFEFIALTNETETEKVTLCGNLCTSTDVIAEDIVMPKLTFGDVVVITNAGSYAAVLSPMQFAFQTPPAQLFLAADGKIISE